MSVPVRDAATVALLRDGPAGIEAWLLTRVNQMVFAAGMSVFPGGRVDAADGEVPWSGPEPETFAARFDCSPELARTLVAAAVRETFEETGVLLCAPAADLSAARADVEAGRIGFGPLLREHGLAIDAGAVHPWSRWVTPEGGPRRYDTRFFVAALPDGAQAADVTTESSVAAWVSAAEALAQAERGERIMLPPTTRTLATVAGFGRVAEVIAAARTLAITPIRPIVRRDGGQPAVQLPDGTLVPLPRGAEA